LLFKLSPPEMKKSEEAPLWARQQLEKLGPLSLIEKKMMGIFALTLGLWIFAEQLHINATTTAMLGVSMAIMAGVITFEDALSDKDAWHTLLWLGILIGMSKYLQIFGFVDYLTGHLSHFLTEFSGIQSFYLLTISYFFLGYMFAGNSAHVSALYIAFLSLLISLGAPPLLSALVLAFMSSLYSSLTHYGSTAGGVYFSTNFVHIRTWWSVGFVVSMVNLSVWLGLGSIWWRYLGLFSDGAKSTSIQSLVALVPLCS
jgi:DASS family divalent anion:Na+ symporter